jgi:prepilin-type processing-associated H-X9-DG protein
VGRWDQPGATGTYPAPGREYSDYGMNARAHRLYQDSPKILVVEYHKPVADVVGLDAPDVWSYEVAPRHLGMLNVLYVDGHVESHRPDDISPEVPALNNELWRPTNDPEMPEG